MTATVDSGPDTDTPQMADVIAAAGEFLELADTDALIVAAAVAVTTESAGDEPAWLLLVGPPSCAKTEIVRSVDHLACQRMDKVTDAGLLGWHKIGFGKKQRAVPGGVLTKLGEVGMVSIGDLSTLLSGPQTTQDAVFSALRRVSDGAYSRDIAAPCEPDPPDAKLEWKGRVTVFGAVTNAIDRYLSFSQDLGPRMLFYRLPVETVDQRRKAGRKASSGIPLTKPRANLADAMRQVVTAGRDKLDHVTLALDVADAAEDAALVCSWGRASVPRHGYGQREIDGVPEVEGIGRLVRALTIIGRGLVALDQDDATVAALLRKIATDSMPRTRAAALAALSAAAKVGEPGLTTSDVARRAHLDRGVARRTLEDLEALTGPNRIVTCRREGEPPGEGERDLRPAWWSLTPGDNGDLIQGVFSQVTSYTEGVPKNRKPPYGEGPGEPLPLFQ